MQGSAEPRYITFDCYGTLIDFQIDRTLREIFGDRLPPHLTESFCRSAEAYRFDEVLGEYRPYRDVIAESTRRAAHRHHIPYAATDGERVFAAVPTWGPHPEVPAVLTALAHRYALVILSNSDNDLIGHSVKRLGTPFHAVLTAQDAGYYKPRLAAFEYMLDTLGCGPEDILHVSASPRYDLQPALDVGITHTILVNRDQEPLQPWLGYTEIGDLTGLRDLLL